MLYVWEIKGSITSSRDSFIAVLDSEAITAQRSGLSVDELKSEHGHTKVKTIKGALSKNLT